MMTWWVGAWLAGMALLLVFLWRLGRRAPPAPATQRTQRDDRRRDTGPSTDGGTNRENVS